MIRSLQSNILMLTVIATFTGGLAIHNAMARPFPAESNADWQEGVVILVNDGVLTGEVYYNAFYQLVLLRAHEGQPVTTLTARQVQRFFYYDSRDSIVHRFVAIEQPQHTYVVRSFYELVAEGPVSYLRQPNRCAARPPQGSSPHTVSFNYFAYYQGKVIRAHAFERELLPALAQQHPRLIDYLKAQQLKPYEVGDQILLVKYFNQQLTQPLANLVRPE